MGFEEIVAKVILKSLTLLFFYMNYITTGKIQTISHTLSTPLEEQEYQEFDYNKYKVLPITQNAPYLVALKKWGDCKLVRRWGPYELHFLDKETLYLINRAYPLELDPDEPYIRVGGPIIGKPHHVREIKVVDDGIICLTEPPQYVKVGLQGVFQRAIERQKGYMDGIKIANEIRRQRIVPPLDPVVVILSTVTLSGRDDRLDGRNLLSPIISYLVSEDFLKAAEILLLSGGDVNMSDLLNFLRTFSTACKALEDPYEGLFPVNQRARKILDEMLYPRGYHIPPERTPLQNELLKLWENLSAYAQQLINYIQRLGAYSQGYNEGITAALQT